MVRRTAQNDWQQSHEYRHQNDRKERRDSTLNPVRAVVNELKELDLVRQKVDVGDSTDDSRGDGPENDQGDNKSDGRRVSNDALPPFDAQIGPDDLGGLEANVSGGHMQGQIVSNYISVSDQPHKTRALRGHT